VRALLRTRLLRVVACDAILAPLTEHVAAAYPLGSVNQSAESVDDGVVTSFDGRSFAGSVARLFLLAELTLVTSIVTSIAWRACAGPTGTELAAASRSRMGGS
jgi:hypothetical protein